LGAVARVAKTIVFSLLPLAALFLVLEIGWRIHLAHIGRGFFDDSNEFTSPFFTTYEEPVPRIDGDRLHYRNGVVERRKAPGEIRVISFGGSTTVNYRAGISYPEILERDLAQDFGSDPPIRVLNAGSEGYSTAHVLVNFSLRNLDAAPDIITLYENINDLSAVWFGDGVTSDYANKYETDYYLGMRHRTGLIAAVAGISRFGRMLIQRVDALRFPKPAQYYDRDIAPGLAYFERNLVNIVAIARAHGIRVLLATQPAQGDCRHSAFRAYNETIRKVAAAEHVTLVDLEAVIPDDGSYLEGDCIHNNRAGVERVAAALREPLATLVREVRAAEAQTRRD
jgi:lysophospholipase L1-like esterase